ncbi:hypothetical protein L7F22_004496 [Adiantum nelumboides]|nr:hypothetical protein [Adiantum nelumboides]
MQKATLGMGDEVEMELEAKLEMVTACLCGSAGIAELALAAMEEGAPALSDDGAFPPLFAAVPGGAQRPLSPVAVAMQAGLRHSPHALALNWPGCARLLCCLLSR